MSPGRASPIGGFFGLETAVGEARGAPFEAPHRLAFWNARAALAHLLAACGAARVWLPAYICREPAEAAARDGREVRFYAVGADLAPEVDGLAASLRGGDAVLGVDYFGTRAVGLPELAAARRDVVWIQDRAQALWPDPEPWGDHLLYSPRKVMGAPDGGVLVSRRDPPPPPAWAADADLSRLEASRLRAAHPLDNDRWFPLYQAAEAAMTCEPRPISALSAAVIAAADTAAMLQRRRRNAELLLSRVGDAALFPAERLLAGSASGVPVVTADAGAIAARMAHARVFCARHWAELPSPTADYPREHALARKQLTLPCDHRYGDEDMARVADAFLAAR